MTLPISADSNGDFHVEFGLTNGSLAWTSIADITIPDPSVASFAKLRISAPNPNCLEVRVTVYTTDGYPLTCLGMPGELGSSRWFDAMEGDADGAQHTRSAPTEEVSDGQVVITIPGGDHGFLDTILWVSTGEASRFVVEVYGSSGGHGLVRGALGADHRPNGWV